MTTMTTDQQEQESVKAAPEPEEEVDALLSPEESDGDELDDVRDMFSALDKAIKQLIFYEGKGKNCEFAVSDAYRQLDEVLEARGEITVRVAPYEFILGEDPVYIAQEEKKGLTFRLFRDGIRRLTFMSGMPEAEFREILDLLRAPETGGAEDNIVTKLWERGEEGHFKFRAIELFQEGLVDSDMGGTREDLGAVADALGGAMFQDATPVAVRKLWKPGDPAPLKKRLRAARALVKAFSSGGAEATRLEVEDRLEEMRSQLWTRAIHVASLMVPLEKGASSHVTEVLATVLEDMLTSRRWEMLADTLKLVRGALGETQKGDMDRVLDRLATDAALGGLAIPLEACDTEDFDPLAELFRALPAKANPVLLRLLVRVPEGEVQDAFSAVLQERGVDLTDLHVRRLRGGHRGRVMAAMTALTEIGSDRAYAAVATLLWHKSPKIKLEALRAMRGRTLDARTARRAAPALIPSIASRQEELRDLALTLLEGLPNGPYGNDMLAFVKVAHPEKWEEERRDRVLRLLVRWGGKTVDAYIVDQVCGTRVLFFRKRGGVMGDALLEAARQEGGVRGKKVLQACLAGKPPPDVEEKLKQAMAALA